MNGIWKGNNLALKEERNEVAPPTRDQLEREASSSEFRRIANCWGIEKFLLEHKVIPMPLAQCLVVRRSNPTVVQAQKNGVRMRKALQLKKGLNREEPTFMAIPFLDEQFKLGWSSQ
ncbi:Asp_protease_2 domain-containing protein [Cucumis melo var. makuwa]|uniref:Asp_protease_2 domain-containing protein n=1 Tax=Cucumis melo var. makuwa TaxID=1194695 RepID=A0A5A7T202_CUCMM|nr:Asp_protease_2 domain-containing protein [Cucumis melo var. makuwa]TYK01969.1 Asp_protease_2 domain-containing protein [Cucumis melo var. makuwa]